ncbi:methionyl-tRNA formyltransferase [bacterium]|nr:methionyl-tRNA formyltransferase [bacterium]
MNEEKAEVKKQIVFLGTPAIVVPVLERLLIENPFYQVIAVVSQPPTRATRGNSLTLSPVQACAEAAGLLVLTPENAKAPDFIAQLAELSPDVCVTAAYGQVLSEEFLALPKHGTLNIHPSLLPLYRGAAPVQRALEDGVSETGVTVARTVRAMDAGPIVAQLRYRVDQSIKAPELLSLLFKLGAEELVRILPDYFSGRCEIYEQEHARATKAKKLSVEESLLRPDENTATALHNRVRGFAGWPGTRLLLSNVSESFEVKVITTRVSPKIRAANREIVLQGDALEMVCGDGSVLEILELQAPGKRAMMARDFWNGMKTKNLRWV